LLADVRERGGESLLELVRPRSPAGATTILGDEAVGEGALRPLPGADLADGAALLASARVPEGARPFLEAASAVAASNAWVVGGGRSRSGKPLLANDMHLT